MYIAMNRFKVKRGSEEAFEKVWSSRESYLDRMPGVEFHLLKGPEAEDHNALFVAYRVAEPCRVRGLDQIGGIPRGACPRRQ